MANLEIMDKSYFNHLGLAHSAPDTIIYEKVGISGPANHSVPHSNIDLLAFTQSVEDSALALNYIFDGRSVTGNCTHLTPTTAKSQHKYASPGSERQAIVELLSLTKVLLQKNPNIPVFSNA